MIEVDSKRLVEIDNITYLILYGNFRIPFTGYEVKHFSNGNLNLKKYYLLGKLEGLIETYYQDGQAKLLTIYKTNKLDGPYEEYSEEGYLIINAYYKENVRHGYYERYQNGYLFFCAQYENGKVKETTKKFFR